MRNKDAKLQGNTGYKVTTFNSQDISTPDLEEQPIYTDKGFAANVW